MQYSLLEYAASYQQSPHHPLQHSKHLCNKSSATPLQQPFLSMLPRSDQKTTPYSTHNSTFLTFNLSLCTVVFTLLLSLYIRLSCNQKVSAISNNVVLNFLLCSSSSPSLLLCIFCLSLFSKSGCADHVRVSRVVLETTKHFIVWENYDSRLGHLEIVDVILYDSICNNW
jgi:hypothetical protein